MIDSVQEAYINMLTEMPQENSWMNKETAAKMRKSLINIIDILRKV